jgi:hypothetical protein
VANTTCLHLDEHVPCIRLGIARSTISKSPPGLEIRADFISAFAAFEVAITASCR